MKNKLLKKKSDKKIIINDPIYDFISIPFDIIYDLLEHPWFQRLRRIRQVGLTHFVYPGAQHTRFHHALGAMHLVGEAIEVIRSKGHVVTDEEARGVTIAVLLHDIGHGPFSHALENSIVYGINHEELSVLFMEQLNRQFRGKLSTAIRIYKNKYPKKFLHQLVSSQLDMDRLDYLMRDSFYTGVSEGVVNTERIIKMLNVYKNELAVDAKGIYSIEKFLIARRIMYWQVYLHKTVLAAEDLLVKILKRAKEVAEQDKSLFSTPSLHQFLYNKINKKDFVNNSTILPLFAELDDNDIFASIKVWKSHPDIILSTLCNNIVVRNLHKIEMKNEPFDPKRTEALKRKVAALYRISPKETEYFVFSNSVVNSAYNSSKDRINILYKDGTVKDIAEASDQLNIAVLSSSVRKHYLCYPKECA